VVKSTGKKCFVELRLRKEGTLKIRIFVRWQDRELFKSVLYMQFIAARPRILKSSTTSSACK